MFITELYYGQGLGNQLWCYVVTRAIAKKNGYDFGIMSTYKFHGSNFMKLDFGKKVIGGSGPEGGPPITLPEGIERYYQEKKVMNGVFDVSPFDENMTFLPDNTKIDGIMQTEKYFLDIKEEVIDWLKIDEDKVIKDYSKDVCVIHIRGGDFLGSTAFMNREYYTNAIEKMKEFNSGIKFYVVTDDVNFTRHILPEIEIIGGSFEDRDETQASHHRGGTVWKDYSIINNAEYLIIGASSFAWWPAWTNKNVKQVIAPKYWAAYKQSDGFWSTGDIKTKGWLYLDRNNQLED